jgi:Xaa-Pro aminopeptidase
MVDEKAVRIKSSVSNKELERRWTAVRKSMKDKNLDFLIMQNSTDYLGGYVKWFTDIPVRINYPATVIFPRDDDMITIWHGSRPPAEQAPPPWAVHGVKKRISVPLLPSLMFTTNYDGEKVVEELSHYRNCRIGLVGMGTMSASLYKYLTEHLTEAVFEDATELVDLIKAIKSDEEMALIREVCAMQDEIFAYTLKCVKPGKRDYQVFADIMYKVLDLGGEQANIMVGSSPYGTPGKRAHLHYSNRVIENGDQFAVLIESNGPSGFYCEIERVICLGKASPELEEQFVVAQKAQKKILDILKPGMDAQTVWDTNNEFLKSLGYAEETRVFAHGMGYDFVERPSLMPGETMKVQAGMNMTVHPTVLSSKALGIVCENYFVTANGVSECLHKTPQKIFII